MKIGFLINPVAGMGGKVALKGTDGEETLRRALELGAVPMAGTRAEEAVKEFAENAGDCRFYSPSGGMGADLLKSYGLETELLFDPSTHTTPADTKRAAEMMLERGVGLVVFAGGCLLYTSNMLQVKIYIVHRIFASGKNEKITARRACVRIVLRSGAAFYLPRGI